jgi:hypothetical protein
MTTQTGHPTTVPDTRAAQPSGSRSRVSATTGGRAALAYGFLAMAVGAAQAVRTGDTSVEIATGMRWILVAFALSLLVVVPAHLALGAFARSPLGARIAAVGTPLLAVGAASSAVNGQDLAWFPAVAVVANALWLIGSVTLGVSLWRAGRVPRWVAVLLPISMPVTLVLSQLGSGLAVGAFWVAVGALMVSGQLGRD